VAHEFLVIEHGSDRYRETVGIRDRILRSPLGLEFSDAELAAESSDHHLVAIDAETREIIACLVLTPLDEEAVQMRQVAVIETRRGEGIGKCLVSFSEQQATRLGFELMQLHAREPVVPFYEALGYEVIGEPFIEVTLPHRAMKKPVGP